MSSESADGDFAQRNPHSFERVEFHLFDSLVHHLIEKGLLTKNDALSVVRSAASVVRGQIEESGNASSIETSLSALERTYASFEALPDRYGRPGFDADNVRTLRPPLHGDNLRFSDDS